MKRLVALLMGMLVYIAFLGSVAIGQVTEAWISRYNGPGNSEDYVTALTVDGAHNVYVTGASHSNSWLDYATIKYDSSGNELWASRYNGPGSGADIALAIAVDATNNVYVTGVSYSNESFNDYATIKYDSLGNELWVRRYNGPGNGEDIANAIAVDAFGNVYVTGKSYSGVSWPDFCTIKYDSNGNELWVARYNGPGNGEDYASAMELDFAGNLYVSGRSYSSVNGQDFTTIKYVSSVTIDLNCLTPTVHRGERLQYEATFTNNTGQRDTVKYWSKVKMPSGSWYPGYVVSPTEIILNPNQTLTRAWSHLIPQTAPYGVYEYWGYVGPDTTQVWDCDMFNFSVVP